MTQPPPTDSPAPPRTPAPPAPEGNASAAPARRTDPIVGIDLGTTNSLVAHCTEAGPVILKSPAGRASLPSVVRLLATPSSTDGGGNDRKSDAGGSAAGALNEGGADEGGADGGGGYRVEALGEEARDQALRYPGVTLHSTKRLLGRSAADLADDLPHLAYRVVEGPHATARIQLPPAGGDADTDLGDDPDGTSVRVTPQEVAALLLRELKAWADAALGTPVTRAVITVPAYFDDAQRQATRDAGRLAGLEVLRLVNEPTAAALAYGLGLHPPTPAPPSTPASSASSSSASTADAPGTATKTGPATISLNTKLNPDACASPPEQISPGSDQDTGSRVGRDDPPPAGSQRVAIYDLGGGTFDISVLRLQPTPEGGTLDQVLATDGDTHLGGDDLDQRLVALFTKEIIEQACSSETGPGKVDASGGQAEKINPTLPAELRQALRQAAEQAKVRLSEAESTPVRVDLSAWVGGDGNIASDDNGGGGSSAVYRRTLTRGELDALIEPLIDRTLAACRRALKNADLSAADLDQVILVGGSTRVPLVRQKVAEFFGREPYTALDPDQVVALGASVQAAVLAGIRRDTLLLDVIPLSLGIETMGGAVAKLITANSTIPARATERFSTYVDGQANVKIHVLQGERELVQDCRSLATFDLTGIPPMPAGLPKILVTFLVDANGILSVQALEERSGRRARVQVLPHHGLTPEEVAQIEADSFTHARADMRAHRLIDLRLNAKLDLRNIQKQLDRFPAPDAGPAPDSEAPPPGAATEATADHGGEAITLDPGYRREIQQHLAAVQAFIDAPDDEVDPDRFQQALHDLDHATLRLAELNIARTLREDAATP